MSAGCVVAGMVCVWRAKHCGVVLAACGVVTMVRLTGAVHQPHYYK